MNFANDWTLWLAVLAVAGLMIHGVTHLFSPETRERRRCRRNHRKVISRARRPVVMLSARVPRM